VSLADYFPSQIRALPAFDGQFDALKLSAESCDVLFGICPAGTVITSHSHTTNNVGIVTKGRLLLTMNAKTQHIAAGEWYFVPAGTEHVA